MVMVKFNSVDSIGLCQCTFDAHFIQKKFTILNTEEPQIHFCVRVMPVDILENHTYYYLLG